MGACIPRHILVALLSLLGQSSLACVIHTSFRRTHTPIPCSPQLQLQLRGCGSDTKILFHVDSWQNNSCAKHVCLATTTRTSVQIIGKPDCSFAAWRVRACDKTRGPFEETTRVTRRDEAPSTLLHFTIAMIPTCHPQPESMAVVQVYFRSWRIRAVVSTHDSFVSVLPHAPSVPSSSAWLAGRNLL